VHKIVHDIHPTSEGQAQQNFDRGFIAAIEWISDLEQDVKAWIEQGKRH
jgi:hypothetical protein